MLSVIIFLIQILKGGFSMLDSQVFLLNVISIIILLVGVISYIFIQVDNHFKEKKLVWSFGYRIIKDLGKNPTLLYHLRYEDNVQSIVLYTDKGSSIRYPNVPVHLYQKLLKFLIFCPELSINFIIVNEPPHCDIQITVKENPLY